MEAFGPLHPFFGPVLAFLLAWVVVLLLKPASLAILGLALANYTVSPILNALGYCEDSFTTYIISRLVACVFIGNTMHKIIETCF